MKVTTIALRVFCIGVLASVYASPVAAEDIKATCHGLDARVISVGGMRPEDGSAAVPAEIRIVLSEQLKVLKPDMGRPVRVVLFGPVLGSMDSVNETSAGLVCTDEGMIVTVTIKHLGNTAVRNLLWRPRVELALSLHQQQVVVEGKWIMRDRTGTLVDSATGWGGPEEKFPLTIEKMIAAAIP